MVTKTKRSGAATSKSRVKVGNLNIKKETVKDLSSSKRKQIKGGALALSRVVSVCGCAK